MYRQRKLGESDHILISNNSSCMYMSQIIELDRKYKPKKAIRTIDFIPIRKKITFQKNAFVRVQFLSLSIHQKVIILCL